MVNIKFLSCALRNFEIVIVWDLPLWYGIEHWMVHSNSVTVLAMQDYGKIVSE